MCGILGYAGTGFSVSRFAGALRLLAHRGPFGEGIAALPNGAIGMTRLPMSGAAAVPLPPQEGQRRVAYNGEVYQAGCEIHGEIRLLLDGLQRGVLPDGMYALASWDPQTRQLTLLRDEFGIKPLYYSYQPERGLLAFASEPRALLHLLGGARADAEAIAQVVAAGVPLEGQTLFQQVRLLLPGEVLRFDLSQERPRLCQRQRLATAPASEVDSLDEQLGETLERCRQTFRPCALLVSGGVDSNLLGSYLDPQLQRFHLCLEGDEESLLPHPRLQRFELRQEAFMPLLRRAVGNFGGATRMSSLLMYQRLADGIGEQGYHCVLLGEGADELFWGYPRHLELWRRRDAPEPRRFAAAWFGEYRRKAALLAEPAGRRVAERIEELAHEALGQGLEAAIGQFDLHYSLEPLLRRADHLLMSRTIEARTPLPAWRPGAARRAPPADRRRHRQGTAGGAPGAARETLAGTAETAFPPAVRTLAAGPRGNAPAPRRTPAGAPRSRPGRPGCTERRGAARRPVVHPHHPVALAAGIRSLAMTTIHRRPAPWRGNAVFCASAAFAAGLETLFARLLERRPADSAEALLRQRLHHELEHGSGVLLHDSALLRGLAEDEFQRVFRAFCQWLGRTVAINRNGEYLKEVRDLGLRDARDAPQRGHLTSQELAFHSDRADLTVLACWSPARRGGAFRIRSSADVLATLEAANPAWLPLLGQPIPHDLRDEGDADYALVPLLTETPRTFVLRYIRKFNESVTRHGLSLAPQVRSMLDGLDEAIERADGYAELDFSKGMLVLVNNHTTLHARTEFSDDERQRRCLLRCWLSSEFTRELPESFLPLFHQVAAGSLRGGIRPLAQEPRP
ncbi:TPA: TauD/TfdA family dioxygenase [Pseudomonas aeruginosa]|nr:TauD/TfdA family dioxygenase [Pseudomonas aeruginosa]HEJ4073161.1 TauD/TfdA family dioxygenase [Pseudomonas aeruginosa]